MGNPLERKFKEFANDLSAKNAQAHAEATAGKSADVFADKTFTHEFQGVYRVAQVGQGLAQVVTWCTTAALGVFALTHIIPTTWGIYIAVPLGIVFAFGVERLKRSTLTIASKHLLKYKTFGFVGVVALAVMCVSIAAALYGAKELPGVVYAKPERVKDAGSVAALTADIERVQTDIERTRMQKGWVAENRTLPRLQRERAALVERRDKATGAAEGRADAQHAEALADRAERIEKMQVYSVGAAIAAELVFLFCTGFVLYYLFRHYAETSHGGQATTGERIAAGAVNGQASAFAANGHGNGNGQHHAGNIGNFAQGATTANEAPRRPIGFNRPPDDDNGSVITQPLVPHQKDPFFKVCDHCGENYHAAVRWQRFCTEPCKLAYHEAKHGRKFDPTYKKKPKAANP